MGAPNIDAWVDDPKLVDEKTDGFEPNTVVCVVAPKMLAFGWVVPNKDLEAAALNMLCADDVPPNRLCVVVVVPNILEVVVVEAPKMLWVVEVGVAVVPNTFAVPKEGA